MKCELLLDFVLVLVVGLYLLLAPYTKVEESFNMQAIHDILNHGVFPAEVLENYDHKVFPGVVPRSFIGSLLLAGVTKAIDVVHTVIFGSSLISDGDLGQLRVQIIVRAVLGLANILGLVAIRKSVNKIVYLERKSAVKGFVGFFFTLLLLSQFHLNFYSTRTLPNFVALPLVTYALSKLVAGDMSGLTWLALTGAIFRLEIGIFAGSIALVSSFVFGQSSIVSNTFLLVAGTLVGLTLTTCVDSYFWGRLIVPEFEAFKFNIVHGQSVNWGVEPYGAYFSKYILNFFRPPHVIVLAILGFLNDPAHDGKPLRLTEEKKIVVTHPARHSLRILFIASIVFVAIMSFQPHKEWRFIVYIIPVWTLLAANGLTNLFWKRSQLFAHKILLLVVLASFVLSFVFSIFMTYVSSFNYPGGNAISFLNAHLEQNSPKSPIVVHMDVASCMTGVTKFTELHNPLIEFDKTEKPQELSKKWNDFTYLITQVDLTNPPDDDLLIYDPNHWKTLTVVPAFAGVNSVKFLMSFSRLHQDSAYRDEFIEGVWGDLKQGRFDTIEKFLRQAVILRDFIYVYERTAEDAMPVIILDLVDEKVSESAASTEEAPLEDIQPDEVKEEINEQIDDLEDQLEQDALKSSLPNVEVN